MNRKSSIVMIGVILWTLGVLFGGSVSKLFHGTPSILPPVVVMTVALLATVANLIMLYYKIKHLDSGKA